MKLREEEEVSFGFVVGHGNTATSKQKGVEKGRRIIDTCVCLCACGRVSE